MPSQHKKWFDVKNAHQDKERCSRCGDSIHVEGFQCPAKKFQCKACHKFWHFTSLCYQKRQAPFKSRKPKAHQLQAGAVHAKGSAIYGQSEDFSSSDDSFCLQIKVQCIQANLQKIPQPSHLITNLAYRLKSHHTRNLYLRAGLDTCGDVNIMPASMYRLVFKDPEMKKLAPSSLDIGTYTTDTVKIVGSCMFYLVHLDTRKLMDTTFFVAVNDGSVLLSSKTTLMLGLIQPRTKLDYLPPRSSLITSSADHPRKLNLHFVYRSRKCPFKDLHMKWLFKCQDRSMQFQSWSQAKNRFCKNTRCLWRDWQLPRSPISYIDWPKCYSKQTPCHPIPLHLKEAFKQEVDKMLQAGVLKPVHEATPWINSFVPGDGKDKSGNLKLHICFDPTNLNKTIIREPYHFRMPEDTSHLLADACIMTVCNCKKGYWHQKLDEASSFLTTFNTEIRKFRYTVMTFGATMAGDVFQHKLDQCFGMIKQVIVFADGNLIVGKHQNHRDHDLSLLDTARKCNVQLNCDTLQYKKTEVDFFGEHILQVAASLPKAKCLLLQKCQFQPVRRKCSHLLGW